MPYANIHWIKLQLELLNDKRFIFDCNNEQKWLFIGLLLLAGATKNNIPDNENYLKNRLNIAENTSVIRENLRFLFATFPKLVSKNNVIKFKNFNALHNRLKEVQRDSNGHEIVRVDKIRIDKIREEYTLVKGLRLDDFSSDDFGRTAKAIKKLILKAKNNDALVVQGLKWAAAQKWCDWTLETLERKWADFMKTSYVPEGIRKFL